MTLHPIDQPFVLGQPARLAAIAGAALLLSGCSVTRMFDPAIHEPRSEGQVRTEAALAEGEAIFPFPDLDRAATRLAALADSYARVRDDMRRGQAVSDVLLLGTTAAAVINPLFQGAREATLALTVSGAVVGAGRIYLSPATRAAAYQAGYDALTCAAGIADDLRAAERRAPAELQSSLEALLAEAGSAAAGTVLATAITAGEAALTEVRAARAVAQAAPDSLTGFARNAIRTTAQRASTGTLNFTEALAQINGLAKPPAATETAGSAASAASRLRLRSLNAGRRRDADTIALELTRAAAEATRYSQAVKDAWARVAGCVIANNS